MFGSQARPGLGSLGDDSLGAMTYKLEPTGACGSLGGDSLGAMDGGGASNAAPITAYGKKAAKALLDTVKEMPPADRKRQLQLALDKIDPKLWSRADQAAEVMAKRGVPAGVALERALGAAMSFGFSSELIELAEGKGVKKHTQLGAALGLGDVAPTRAGYCFIAATSTVPGHWERMRAGQTSCADQQPAGVTAPVVRDHTADGGGGGVTVTDPAGNVIRPIRPPAPPPTPSPEAQKFLKIGPFLIPVTAGAWRDHRPLPAEQKAYVDENIATAAKAGGVSIAELKTGKYPFVKFDANGEKWGLFYTESDGTLKTSRGTTIPAGTTVAYHKIASTQLGVGGYAGLGWSITGAVSDIGGAIKDAAVYVGGAIADVFRKIWAGIKYVVAKVVDFVKDAAKWIADKACALLNKPGVVEATQAVATAAPNPYTVGVAAGATVGKMLCPADEKPAAETPGGGGSGGGKSMLPIVLAGGAGLLLLIALRKKKK
jgi:hypothetical protein